MTNWRGMTPKREKKRFSLHIIHVWIDPFGLLCVFRSSWSYNHVVFLHFLRCFFLLSPDIWSFIVGIMIHTPFFFFFIIHSTCILFDYMYIVWATKLSFSSFFLGAGTIEMKLVNTFSRKKLFDIAQKKQTQPCESFIKIWNIHEKIHIFQRICI